MRSWAPGFLSLCILLGCSSDPPGWNEIHNDIASRWPDVNQLSTSELAAKLASGERILLVDVRHRAEYRVSHIPRARHVPEGSALPEDLGDLRGYDSIVFYCSVGYRSSAAAADVGSSTGKRIYNLEGSIFKWANEGRPLENENGTADKVHPYDEQWGKLLDEAYRTKP